MRWLALSIALAIVVACGTDPGRATFYEVNGAPPPAVTNTVPPASDAFFGTDKFEGGHQGSHDSTLATDHPNGNPGLDCQTSGCHDGTNVKAPKWIASGTAYTTTAGATAVAEGAEVRINDASGNKLASVYTDKVGNFVFDGSALPAGIPSGAHVALRNATSKSSMGGTPGGACNSGPCHAQTAPAGRVSISPN